MRLELGNFTLNIGGRINKIKGCDLWVSQKCLFLKWMTIDTSWYWFSTLFSQLLKNFPLGTREYFLLLIIDITDHWQPLRYSIAHVYWCVLCACTDLSGLERLSENSDEIALIRSRLLRGLQNASREQWLDGADHDGAVIIAEVRMGALGASRNRGKLGWRDVPPIEAHGLCFIAFNCVLVSVDLTNIRREYDCHSTSGAAILTNITRTKCIAPAPHPYLVRHTIYPIAIHDDVPLQMMVPVDDSDGVNCMRTIKYVTRPP